MTKTLRAARAVALALLLSIGISAQSVTFSDEEKATCLDQGGCVLITKARLLKALEAARELGAADALDRSCNRDRT